MWFNNYFSWIFLMSLLNCNFVINNGQQKELYGDIYLAQNIVPGQIKRKFMEIMKSAIKNKRILIGSNRKYNTKGQDVELTGAIVILKNVQNDNKTSEEDTTHTNNNTSVSKWLEKQKSKPILKHDNRKIILTIVDNGKKISTQARQGLSIEDLRDAIPEATMDHAKSNILRDKYGEACIKVAIRKCYKALRAVSEIVCKYRFKCKSDLKSKFKNKSKVGCINEFDFRKGINKKKNLKSAKFKNNAFIDVTRERYLDACIPYMVPKYMIRSSSITLRNYTPLRVFANVLRNNRSYNKCQRLSRTKCFRVCLLALEQSCAQHKCSVRRKRSFSEACKDECRKAYRMRRGESSESSSES